MSVPRQSSRPTRGRHHSIPGSLALLASLTTLPGLALAQASGDATVRHVLNRMAHGPTLATRVDIAAIGLPAWIQDQLSVSQGHPNPSVQTLLDTLDELPVLHQQRGNHSLLDLSRMQVAYALYSRDQLVEQMTDFWETHFNVNYHNIWRFYGRIFDEPEPVAQSIGIYFTWLENQDFRENALGSFGDLLLLSAHGPGMLEYLDSTHSRKTNPNENYARELLELYTLGVGYFRQEDVLEAAKLFTGVEIERVAPEGYGDPLTDRVTLEEAFSEGDLNADGLVDSVDQNIVMEHLFTNHPEGDVNKDGSVNFADLGIVVNNLGRILWVYGPWFNEDDYVEGSKQFYLDSPSISYVIDPPEAPTRAEKYAETTNFLEHLSLRRRTAEYVSAKLIAAFVRPIDPDSPIYQWPLDLAQLRGACADAWQQTGGDLREVLRTLLSSSAFVDADHRGTITETAFESVVSVVRAFEADHIQRPLVTTYAQLESIRAAIEDSALQRLFEYPAPDGYQTSPPGSANLLARLKFSEDAFESGTLSPDWTTLLPGNYPSFQHIAKAALTFTYGTTGFSNSDALEARDYLEVLSDQGASTLSEFMTSLTPLITSYPQGFRK